MTGDPDPGFDCHTGSADAVAFVDHHARDLLTARIVELVPLAGGAGGEYDVGAVAVLHRPAHDRALLVLQHLARRIEDGDDWNRKPGVGDVAMNFPLARPLRRSLPSNKSQLCLIRHRAS